TYGRKSLTTMSKAVVLPVPDGPVNKMPLLLLPAEISPSDIATSSSNCCCSGRGRGKVEALGIVGGVTAAVLTRRFSGRLSLLIIEQPCQFFVTECATRRRFYRRQLSSMN